MFKAKLCGLIIPSFKALLWTPITYDFYYFDNVNLNAEFAEFAEAQRTQRKD